MKSDNLLDIGIMSQYRMDESDYSMFSDFSDYYLVPTLIGLTSRSMSIMITTGIGNKI